MLFFRSSLLSAPLVLAGATLCLAAGVPTERVIAPRAMEPPPSITTPPGVFSPEEAEAEPKPEPENDDSPVSVEDESIPLVHYGENGLPAVVRRMRKDLLEAARAVDFDRLRLIYDSNEEPPTLSFGDIDDPIDFLKESSGDKAGHEVLAILIEVLEAGWVHINQGEPDEMFIWPYFAEIPLDSLTPQQKVELYTIVTAGDVEEMETYGSYIFYRLGIGPDGSWYFFVTGD